MRIKDVRLTPVTVPMQAPLRWSMGVETGTTRTIIELVMDDGTVGLGETYGGGATVRAIESMMPMLQGLDCREPERLLRLAQAFRISYESFIPPHVIAGIDMACWDAAGKAAGRSVASLLGGVFREHVDVAAYLFYRYEGADGTPAVDSPEALVDQARQLLEAHRFRTIKLKSGVFAPEAEIEAMRQLRAAFPQARLRYDPNAAWSVETGLRLLPALGELDLEYAEDIVDGLEAMSRLRQAVPVPLATNMCVIAFEHIPLSFRLGSVDIILSDVHFWGGLHLNRKLATVAETLKIGLGMHSDRELGISTAAMVHLAAATPTLVYAIDSHYHQQADDIITEPFRYRDGGFDLPKGPGLGVNLDADKLAHYHRVWQEQGDVNEFLDPRRPGWVPVLPLF